MIYTSRYKNINKYTFKDQVVSISGDRGKRAEYDGKCYPALAPKKSFWQVWFDNRGKISKEDNTKFYIEKYYEEVLSKMDVNKVYKELDEKILLCYEDPQDFCHRQIVAAWFELYTGIKVPEVKQEDYYKLVEVPRDDFVKDYLEKVIKERVDMKGFSSLYSLNLYNKSEALLRNARNNDDYELAKFIKSIAYETDYQDKQKQYHN